jgi:hypothetical protein
MKTYKEIEDKITVAYDDEDGRMYAYRFDGGDRIHARTIQRIVEMVSHIENEESEE